MGKYINHETKRKNDQNEKMEKLFYGNPGWYWKNSEHNWTEEEKITKQYVKRQTQKLKKGKAAGGDGYMEQRM